MIKCEVIEKFTLEKYDLLKNIKRVSVDTYGKLYVGDTFECTEEMAEYLTGKNDKGKTVVKVIEVIPEIIPIPNAKDDGVKVVPLKTNNKKKKTIKKKNE